MATSASSSIDQFWGGSSGSGPSSLFTHFSVVISHFPLAQWLSEQQAHPTGRFAWGQFSPPPLHAVIGESNIIMLPHNISRNTESLIFNIRPPFRFVLPSNQAPTLGGQYLEDLLFTFSRQSAHPRTKYLALSISNHYRRCAGYTDSRKLCVQNCDIRKAEICKVGFQRTWIRRKYKNDLVISTLSA